VLLEGLVREMVDILAPKDTPNKLPVFRSMVVAAAAEMVVGIFSTYCLAVIVSITFN
jgi:hypothetical protein